MKLLYYYSKLNIGGAERSTVRMLNELVKAGDQVILLLRWNGGTLEPELDPRIKKKYLKYDPPGWMSGTILNRFWAALQWVLGHLRLPFLRLEKYDMAISGLFGYDPTPLLNHIHANCYAQMLRNDVQKTGSYGKTQQYMQKYGNRFDLYLGVSDYTTETFRQVYPELAQRAHTLYNFLPQVNAEQQRDVPEAMKEATQKGILRIVTVCRVADIAKGVFRMVDVCAQLVAEGCIFVWYVVGEGPDKEELRKRIKAARLEKTMVLCDGTTDPFSYYAHADLVAVLSYYEGLCGVVNEAKMMKRPLIATRFSAIDEQITDGVNGYIVENNTEAIVSKMLELMRQPVLVTKTAINGMKPELCDNQNKIQKLHQLYDITNHK